MQNTKYEERPVVGYEDRYSVTEDGRVYSLNYGKTGQKREIAQNKDQAGYWRVTLCHNGKRKFIPTHQVVAAAFHDNPEDKPCVDHIDGDKTNNHASNLRWVTYKENNNNPITRKRNSNAQKGMVFTTERRNNISKSKSKYGVSIRRVYPIIPKDELPLSRSSQRGPLSRSAFTYIFQDPTDDRHTQCKALFEQYKAVYLENHQ